ncbi:hypothetical protein IGI04_040048 [Brassica rapa subsp. trilocularis]|uniref:CCHC-type domain-containing protein n=1 Tax=Brassica rapa subsp. trilocularis TaxID=1813537 RepID=A0ABQ7KMF8_BRACM|nr:hypothetical protein IGI04_040048 [Brassica rapa subsp. trilocularis]
MEPNQPGDQNVLNISTELDELSELSDTTLELDELSEQNDTSLELNELSNTEDGAGSAAGRNGPFQPKEKFIKKLVLSFLVRLSPSFDSSFVGPFSILSDLSSYQPYRRVILILVLSSGIRATLAGGVVEEKSCWLKRNPALGQMFGLLKKSKPQQDVYFPFKTVFEKEQLIFDKKQFASNEFDFVQKQKKRQNRCDDEKWVRSRDRPFTKAKRSNCDVPDQNELQTYASLEKMLHKAIHVVRQLKKKGNNNSSSAPKQQSNSSSISNSDLKTNVLSSDKSKAVKTTSKALSTRCFKCHKVGHYANKCQKQKTLVTLEKVETEPEKEDVLPIFDDYAHEPKEGSGGEQNCGHREGSCSIHNPDQTQGEQRSDYGSFAYNPFPFNVTDLRTNLFEERGNDVPWIVDPGQDGARLDPTKVSPSDEATIVEPEANFGRAGRSDTEDGAGLVAGRNGPFSVQRKIHNKFNFGRFYTKFDQAFADGLLPICIKKYQQKESKS